jgi:hypothetical protein
MNGQNGPFTISSVWIFSDPEVGQVANLLGIEKSAAILREAVFRTHPWFRILHLCDVNGRIRGLHKKMFFRQSIQIQALRGFMY